MSGYCKNCGKNTIQGKNLKFVGYITVKVCPMCDDEYNEDYKNCPACGSELEGHDREQYKNDSSQDCQCNTTVFQDEVYKALGWQGGTIHQVIAEIKRLKEMDSFLCKVVTLLLKESTICTPSTGYTFKDIFNKTCTGCNNEEICKFLVDNKLA